MEVFKDELIDSVEKVPVPKELVNLFEAIAGAIYMDSKSDYTVQKKFPFVRDSIVSRRDSLFAKCFDKIIYFPRVSKYNYCNATAMHFKNYKRNKATRIHLSLYTPSSSTGFTSDCFAEVWVRRGIWPS